MLARHYCSVCKSTQPHEVKTPNHVLHLLLAVITFGLWIPMWIILSIGNGPTFCRTCGTRRRSLMENAGCLLVVIIGIIAVIALSR